MADSFAATRGKRKSTGFEALLQPKNSEHEAFVKKTFRLEDYFINTSQNVWTKQAENWDLFLAYQKDTRDPIDEKWRSNVFVPLPFTVTRTKAAQTTELLGNAEPVWQVEASREDNQWYEQSRHYERLLDYVARNNLWRKFLYKNMLSRSVQGTTLFKVVYAKKQHKVTLFASPEDDQRLVEAINANIQAGQATPPNPFEEPAEFEIWRKMINRAASMNKALTMVPAIPLDGPQVITEYEGPMFQQLPLWTVRLDPLVDEMADQKCILHRMVKPLQYVLDRADDDPNSDKPYIKANVLAAMERGIGEQLLTDEEQKLAERMGLNPAKENHPYFEQPVLLHEVWSKDSEFRYSLIMNRKWVINKRPFESPLLTSEPNIFAVRNIIVPGHFYGLSDYHESDTLFKELNTFRRLRMDGATLNTLPVFVKQQGVNLAEAMRSLRPGAIITLPTINAIKSLIDHKLPAEAYREPAEIKQEVDDATEVYGPQKGAPATIGRVTGTEFQGRASSVLLKYKVDASIIEDELHGLPGVCLSLFAQMGPVQLRKEIGGDPDAVVDVSRADLIQALNLRFRFRGATKNIQPDLQVQQLTTAVKEFTNDLSPTERRFVLQSILELLDIRGSSRILTAEGAQFVTGQAMAAAQAQTAGNMAMTDQAKMSQVQVPGSIPPGAAGAMSGGAGGPGGPPAAG